MLKSNPRVVSIIPARSGSKGVPGKNIRNLGGIPLISWSITCSRKTSLIDKSIVSTNSKEYAEISKNWGANVPFLRPDSISQDHSTDLDFVLHALNFLRENEGLPDLLVHLRPTTPFRNPLLVDNAIKLALSDYENFTSFRSVHEMSESAYKSFEINNSGVLVTVFTQQSALDQSNMNRQTYPSTYIANGYVDILKPDFILKTGELHGNKVRPFIVKNTLEVDIEEDFQALEWQLKINPKIKDQLFGGNSVIH